MPFVALALLALAACPMAAEARQCGGQSSRHQCSAGSRCAAGRVSVFGHGGLCAAGEQCCMAGSDRGCVGAGGRCGHSSTCAGGVRSGLCPGNHAIKCCLQTRGYHFRHQRATEALPDDDEPPAGAVRVTPEMVARLSARRTTPSATPAPAAATATPASAAPSSGGLCFPLQEDSVDRSPSATSFASVRPHNGGDFTRCHAGNDIYTKGQGSVVAMSDGVVKNIYGFLKCRRGLSFAVLIWHPSMGMTVNYGELQYQAVNVKVGQRITRGQLLGRSTVCGMLHLEFYNGERSANIQWRLPRPSSSTRACVNQAKPAAIINGYRTLKDLYDRRQFCRGQLVKNPCEGSGPAGWCAGSQVCTGASTSGSGRCNGYGSSRQHGPQNPAMVCCSS